MSTAKTTNGETFWNLCNTIQGLPILAIPYTFNIGGIYMMIALIVVAILAFYTCLLLVQCLYEEHVMDGIAFKRRIHDSYGSIGYSVGGKLGKYIVDILLATELISVAALYPLLLGYMFEKLFGSFGQTDTSNLAILIICLLLIPNALLKDLKQVSFTSIITIICSLIIFTSLIIQSISNYSNWSFKSFTTIDNHLFTSSLAVIVSCYLAQPFVPSIENSMETPDSFFNVLLYSFILMTIINIIAGIFGNLAYFPYVQEVITNNIPDSYIKYIMTLMAGLIASTSYTLPMYTAFEIFEKNTNNSIEFQEPSNNKNIYTFKTQMMRILLIVISVFMAELLPHYSLVLSVVSSVTGMTLEFILPPIFHLVLFYKQTSQLKILFHIFLVLFGISSMLLSLFVSIITVKDCFYHDIC